MPFSRNSFPAAIPPIHTAARVRYRTGVLDVDGKFRVLKPWKKNLILDNGLNNVAGSAWVDCITYAAVGSGTNPTQRDSGATTFTVASGTVTASAGFFVSQDTGRLLKLDTGEEYYLTYVNATSCTVTGPDAAASEGTVWYVNDTQLQTELKRSNSYSLLNAGNGSAWSGSPLYQWTFTRTFIFSAEAGPVTYNEVGWSTGANPTALFGRDVLLSGDSLTAGQQYVISVELTLAVAPNAQVAQSDVGTGCDTTGTAIWENAQCQTGNPSITAFKYINSNGSTSGSAAGGDLWAEPSTGGGVGKMIGVGTATFTLATNTGLGDQSVSGFSFGNAAFVGAYVAGSFERKFNLAYSVASIVGTLYGVTVSCRGGGGSPKSRGWTHKFTTPFAKSGLQTFTVEVTFTWGRILTN